MSGTYVWIDGCMDACNYVCVCTAPPCQPCGLALHSNVEAMHTTIQQDISRLNTMDEDMSKGIESISRINVLTGHVRVFVCVCGFSST